MKRLESIQKLSGELLGELIEGAETFVLYVRSQKDYEKIKEIFDVDVVFPELEKSFGDKVRFFWTDIDDLPKLSELGVFFAPMVLLFKEGKLKKKLEGIKSWAEYNKEIGELLC